MARFPGKSRGCQTCRQRRIKCDEQVPECSQCRRHKTKCPGALTTTFFIICAEERSQPYQVAGKVYPPGELEAEDITKVDRYERRGLRSPASRLSVSTRTDHDSLIRGNRLPCRQPHAADVFDQLYFSHFFETPKHGVETIGACSWLSKLPILMNTSFTSTAMRHSARATCMAFYSTLNGDASVWNEACKMYVRALRSQRGEIVSKVDYNASRRMPSEESICTSVMMTYFEMLSKSTPWAWIQHVDAAATMLKMRGVEFCRSPFILQLFRTTRIGVAYASVLSRKPHLFATSEWQDLVPEHARTELDDLVAALLSIPKYMELHDGLWNTPIQLQRAAIQTISNGLASILSTLESPSKIDRHGTDSDLDSASSTLVDPPRDPWDNCLCALRNAVRVLCYSLMHSTTPDHYLRNQAIIHSSRVLSAIELVDTTSRAPASRIYATTIFPTHIVATWGPSAKHRAQALGQLNYHTRDSVESFEAGWSTGQLRTRETNLANIQTL